MLVRPTPSIARPPRRRHAAAPVTILHAAGGTADLLRLTPVIDGLDRSGGVRQLLVQASTAPGPADPAIRSADHWFCAEGATHGERTALLLHRFERLILDAAPDLVVVCGASDAALACALAAAKLELPIAHLEAGLRATIPHAPGNLNRVLTDRLADTLLTPTFDAVSNLADEGIPDTRVSAVGNTAIDVLREHEQAADDAGAWRRLRVGRGEYLLVVLGGRIDAQDESDRCAMAQALADFARKHPVVLSVPSGDDQWLGDGGQVSLLAEADVQRVRPESYVEHLSLELGAGAILTDVGAVQDEACALGVPCFTLADGTDRPATLAHGTNVLLGTDPAEIAQVRLLRGARCPRPIPLWDGMAGARAAERLLAHHVLVRVV